MNRKPLLNIVCTMIVTFFFTCFSAYAAESNAAKPDIVIKVSRLQEFLTIVDNMMGMDQNFSPESPTMLINAMLQGTDWIDPDRSIVIGIDFQEAAPNQKPVIVALLPFIKENNSFRNTYHAVSGTNYYILSLPPGSNILISDEMKVGLVSSSLVMPDSMFTVEVAVSKMLKKADRQIQDFLLEFDKKLSQMEGTDAELTPKDAKTLITNLLNTAKQIDEFSTGLDITQSELNIFSDVQALDNSELSKLFVRNPESRYTYMGTYIPDYDINFKSNSYNVKGMISFLNANFGEFYRKIGLDLKDIEKMADKFTGEVAGGMSIRDKGVDYEMIVVLRDDMKSTSAFLEDEYLPWVLKYGRKMAEIYSKQNPGDKIENVFSRTPESTILGNRVFGVKGHLPKFSTASVALNKIEFNMRVTRVGNFILAASNDDRLNRLIQLAPELQKEDDPGPLVTVDMDAGKYLESVKSILTPFASESGKSFPQLGKIKYTVDMDKGRVITGYSVDIDDIKKLASFFKMSEPFEPKTFQKELYVPDATVTTSKTETYQSSESYVAPLTEKDAQYWINKGLLFSTYGNYSEAIKFFQKSIDIDPTISSAYFHQGVAYADNGEFKQAFETLSRAIEMSPDNAEYFYGRGWAYLRSGNKEAALKDFQHAADLGSSDAKRTIDRMSR